MPSKQSQSRNAKDSRKKGAPAAVSQALRNTGDFHKRPDIPCLSRFQRRHFGEDNVTRHGLSYRALCRSKLGGGGKLRRRKFFGRDSGQYCHQWVTAGLLENRLAGASQREHTCPRRDTFRNKVLTATR